MTPTNSNISIAIFFNLSKIFFLVNFLKLYLEKVILTVKTFQKYVLYLQKKNPKRLGSSLTVCWKGFWKRININFFSLKVSKGWTKNQWWSKVLTPEKYVWKKLFFYILINIFTLSPGVAVCISARCSQMSWERDRMDRGHCCMGEGALYLRVCVLQDTRFSWDKYSQTVSQLKLMDLQLMNEWQGNQQIHPHNLLFENTNRQSS